MLTIAAFTMVYILCFALGVGVFILSIHWSGQIFSGHHVPLPHGTVVILLLSSLLLIFMMIGSVFELHSVNRPDLKEISEQDYPELFREINKIAAFMGIRRPQRVYISSTVSASLFLTGGFFGCIFPTKRNLEIGLGLINVLNIEELEAVLAHEFGHYSQQSVYLSGPLYAIFELTKYIDKTVEYKKRGTLEYQYYALPYLMRQFIDLFSPLMKRNSQRMIDELEFEADAVAAKYAGVSALVSALYKVSYCEATFNKTCVYAIGLMRSGFRIDDIYKANAVTNIVDGRLMNMKYANSNIGDCRLSRIVKLRLDRLQTQEEDVNDDSCDTKASSLIPDYGSLCIQSTDMFYDYQFGGTVPKVLERIDTRKFLNWSVMQHNREMYGRKTEKINVHIVMNKHLHHLPVIDYFFEVYLDNKKIGRSWYKRGFSYDIEMTPGFHEMKFKGNCVSEDSKFIVLVMARPGCTVNVEYRCRLLKTDYLFTLKGIEYADKK